MLKLIALPVVGFLVGLLIISLGGGGGGIYVGILTLLFNISPAVAASTSLATIIPTTAVGTFSHWRAGNVNFRLGLIMLAGGASGAVAGSLCSGLLPQNVYTAVTGAVMLLLALQMCISYLKKRRGKAPASCHKGKRDIIKALLFGLIGGGMSGLVGLSGGGPIVAGLVLLGCGALETVGTSVFVLLGISVTGFVMRLGTGVVDWQLTLLLAAGTMAGAFVGPILLGRISKQKLEKILQPALLAVTAVMGVLLLLKS